MKIKIITMLVLGACLLPVLSFGAEGKCITGDCVNGKGVVEYPDGAQYSGEFKEGNRHGSGALVSENGKRYEGGWTNDLQNGQGTLITLGGEKYVGEFKDGIQQDAYASSMALDYRRQT